MLKLHTHDCSHCEWLGSYNGADLYRCNDTILARFSCDGPDYVSTSLTDWNNGIYDGSNDWLHQAAERVRTGCEVVLLDTHRKPTETRAERDARVRRTMYVRT